MVRFVGFFISGFGKMEEAMYKYYYDAREMGRRIKEVRRRCRMTQEQLAEHLILTAESVSNIEKGKTVCMPEHEIRICELFEVTADHLYFGGRYGSRRNIRIGCVRSGLCWKNVRIVS